MRPFVPIVTNPHALTILGNFWPRDLDFSDFRSTRQLYRTEPDVQVLVDTQTAHDPQAELILVHGLEGGADAGYMRTLAHSALTQNFNTHRFNMRTCGGTERLCTTLYHGGLTSDLLSYLRGTKRNLPIFLVGFSLGGNVVLKLAGELGRSGPELLSGVCAVSAPIDLAMAARRINAPVNFLYQRRFVTRMHARLAATGRYSAATLKPLRTLYDIDDIITAPSFGFGNAEGYYSTQSSNRLLAQIRVPTLLIAAQDDPLIPFEMYRAAAPELNPLIQTLFPEHGGHLGFIARQKPRFWADETILEWARIHSR